MLVKQSRISDIESEQSGSLYLSALPGNAYEFSVTKVTPVIVTQDGQSYYEVEASLHEPDMKLQLGMEGVGKIEIDQRSIMSIIMRDFLEWLRIQWWSLFG